MSAPKTHIVLSLVVVLLCLIASSNGRPRLVLSYSTIPNYSRRVPEAQLQAPFHKVITDQLSQQLRFGMRPLVVCAIVALSLRLGDICSVRPTISSVCLANTLAIVYDVETQHCKYMGCTTDKKIFATLEDCEKICNNSRHRRLRTKYQNKTNNINREE